MTGLQVNFQDVSSLKEGAVSQAQFLLLLCKKKSGKKEIKRRTSVPLNVAPNTHALCVQAGARTHQHGTFVLRAMWHSLVPENEGCWDLRS